ncbi:MAG: Uma2 family endonuclease [Terricaulis sp.]
MTVARRPQPMDLETFLAWEDTQEEKHELIDGLPVLRRLRLMSGGTPEHALIAANLIFSLRSRLGAGPCRPFTSDLRVIMTNGGLRYPDATVLCRPLRKGEQAVADPKVLFEVLSPSNSPLQLTRLLHEYQGVASVEHIVLVSQDSPFAQIWTRAGADWALVEVGGGDKQIALPAIDVVLALAELYEGVELAPSETN